MDETRSVESMTSFTLEQSTNTFIMQLKNVQKDFDNFFVSRVHSASSPFRTVKCRGHLTEHNDFQGSITRFDHGQFQKSKCQVAKGLSGYKSKWKKSSKQTNEIEIEVAKGKKSKSTEYEVAEC